MRCHGLHCNRSGSTGQGATGRFLSGKVTCAGGCKGITYGQTCHVRYVYPIVSTGWIYSKGQDMGNDDKWDKVAPAGRGRAKVSGEGEGADGKAKGEAQRLKRSDIQRAQETLKEMSPSQVMGMLGIKKTALTHKQRSFAYAVAMGQTKAEAYRQAYKRDAKPSSIKTDPYKIAADPRIAREIEAYKLAQEAAKHRTPQQIRDLVIQTLVQQVIDPDIPPAIRTQATKILGQVTEVAAFTERRESVVHHSSDKLRAQILEQVTALMSGKTIEGETVTHDAASLLDELTSSKQDSDGPSKQAQDTPKLSD